MRSTDPFHVLGIGPADSAVAWRGVPNYGVNHTAEQERAVKSFQQLIEAQTATARAEAAAQTKPRKKVVALADQERWPKIIMDQINKFARPVIPVYAPSRPHLQLPQPQSMSFTLRLNAASEARVDHDVDRHQALFVEEMATDLWWWRRDPARQVVDGIGRFNADKVDLSGGATGVRLSVSWVDYEGLMRERLYLDAQHTFTPGSTGRDVLAYALPPNMGIDLDALTSVNVGTLTEQFVLETGTSISDIMTNLEAICSKNWEWWVEMPTDDGARPVLTFATTGDLRGADNGVVLFDVGSGLSPIESWSMQGSSDTYANTLYYSGSDGGVVLQLAADVAQYGQRDASESDSSLKGTATANIDAVARAGQRRLQKLSVRNAPTFELSLRDGFWQGRTHIDVGDWVTIYVALGFDVVQTKQRVSQIDVNIDDAGREAVSLTCGTPKPARDPRSRHSTVAKVLRKIKTLEPKG